MLHDEVWHAVARDVTRLCDACLRNRMRRVLGRELRFEDITVCRFNVWTGHCHELSAPGWRRIAYAAAVLAFERGWNRTNRAITTASRLSRKTGGMPKC